jgi:hypothetical protein
MADIGGDRTPPRALAAAEEPAGEVSVSANYLKPHMNFYKGNLLILLCLCNNFAFVLLATIDELFYKLKIRSYP